MKKRLERVQSPQLGRAVSLWSYGHWGPPLVVLPTAAGFAHEWEAQGMVEALAPWLEAGKLKLDSPLKVSEFASEQSPTKLGLKPGSTIGACGGIKALSGFRNTTGSSGIALPNSLVCSP